MTKKDVIAQVLSEVSGRSKQEIELLLATIESERPGAAKWNDELPDEDAQRMLSDLRGEGSGILAWLVRGAMAVGRNSGQA